jgi:predicted transcriptional regulator
MRQRKGLVLRDVCGEKVIIGEGLEAVNFGRLMCLNDTAAWLWEKASEKGDFTIEDLAEKLCEEYEVSTEEAIQDVTAIVDKWKEADIVE